MGFFDSSSDTTVLQTTNVRENNFNLQDNLAPSILATGETTTTTVNITDNEAVSDALDSVNAGIDEVFEFARDLAGNLLDFSGQVITGVTAEQAAFSTDSLEVAAAATRSDASEISTTLIKSLSIAGAVVAVSVAAIAFLKGRK